MNKNHRLNIIRKLCKNKHVLDLGCIDHDYNLEKNNSWIHKNIISVAKSVVGVDYMEEDVKKLNKLGYDVVCANVENFNLKKKFDVIVAGELIEHLANPGKFLDSVKNEF